MKNARLSVFMKYLTSRDLILLVICLLLAAVLGAISPHFLTRDNLQINSRYVVEIGLIAIPMTMILIIRGIDISVGSIIAIVTVVIGLSYQFLHLPIALCLLLGLVAAVLCGLLNGMVITRLKVPDLLVTLSTLAIFRGVAQGVGGGQRVYLYDEPVIKFLGEGQFFGIPVGVYILIPAVIVAGLIMDRAVFGRHVYAMGNNEVAARFAGIRVDRIRLIVYVLSGLCSGITAIFLTARLGTARETAGLGMEFEVITAVVVGGTAIAGGEGSIWGTFLGLLLVTMLRNGLNLLGVSGQTQQIIIGSLLILTVLANENIRRRLVTRVKEAPVTSITDDQAPEPIVAESPRAISGERRWPQP